METSCPILNDGTPAVEWIYNLFGDCVYNWQESMSLLFGYLSILFWLNAQMPQVIKNYRIRDAEGLSFGFLTVWLAGDVANFIGCIITGQLPFQIYLAIYFMIVDTVLCIQWLYYVKFHDNFIRRWFDGYNDEIKNKNHPQVIKSANDLITPQNIISNTTKDLNESSSLLSTTPKKYTTMMILFFFLTFNNSDDISLLAAADDNKTIWVGRFFAWLCTFLYLSSRIPQIYQNFCRRSVEGLSMALFFCAAMGNLTYVLGIFTNPHATRATFLEAIPYILGSAGTLVFDGTIFVQYALYNKKQSSTDTTVFHA